MKEIRLILASQSPRRLEILRQIGFQPEVIVSGIEEHTEETIPERVVMDLSRQKAGNVAARLAASLVPVNDLAGRKSRTKAASDRETSGLEAADSRQEPAVVVLGADTVVCTGGRILGKPHSHEEAEERSRWTRQADMAFRDFSAAISQASGAITRTWSASRQALSTRA